MFIQTEDTPNPATMKFLPGQQVLPRGTVDYASVDQAGNSPLARRLFALDGVEGVFLGRDFVSVTKAEAEDWAVLRPMVLGAVMDHFTSGEAVVTGDLEEGAQADEGEIAAQIRELIDTRVRPQVAQDGGDIVFREFRDGVVYLSMRGACSGCPSSTMTLKNGIENMLKYYVPEVQAVQAVE